jgi:hypothetical protein
MVDIEDPKVMILSEATQSRSTQHGLFDTVLDSVY